MVKKRARFRIDSKCLGRYADGLVGAFFALNKGKRGLDAGYVVSDVLWSAIRTQWSEEDLKGAVAAFAQRGDLEPFRQALAASEMEMGRKETKRGMQKRRRKT